MNRLRCSRCEPSIGCSECQAGEIFRDWRSPSPSHCESLIWIDIHKNARLTYLRRLEIVQSIIGLSPSVSRAGVEHGVSAVTASKWLGRYLVAGAAGLLCDKPSRRATALPIVELCRQPFLQAYIAMCTGVFRAKFDSVIGFPHHA